MEVSLRRDDVDTRMNVYAVSVASIAATNTCTNIYDSVAV